MTFLLKCDNIFGLSITDISVQRFAHTLLQLIFGYYIHWLAT